MLNFNKYNSAKKQGGETLMDAYKNFGIYRITNTINSRSYIGKTGVNFGSRWDCHKAQLNGGYHSNPYLQRAWDKYGEEAFDFRVIKIVDNTSVLDDLEKKYIKQYKDKGKSYNILDGGDGGFAIGRHLSEETKRKIGEKNRINMTGKKLSNETKAKMSASQKLRYSSWSEEDRINHGKMTSKYASGYKWSETSKENFALRQHARPNGATLTIETVRKIRQLHENEHKSYAEISQELGIPRHNVYKNRHIQKMGSRLIHYKAYNI